MVGGVLGEDLGVVSAGRDCLLQNTLANFSGNHFLLSFVLVYLWVILAHIRCVCNGFVEICFPVVEFISHALIFLYFFSKIRYHNYIQMKGRTLP
jgi:hypothetical protein